MRVSCAEIRLSGRERLVRRIRWTRQRHMRLPAAALRRGRRDACASPSLRGRKERNSRACRLWVGHVLQAPNKAASLGLVVCARMQSPRGARRGRAENASKRAVRSHHHGRGVRVARHRGLGRRAPDPA
eukprot:Amastigsp_a12623_14.p2 type:complete len:129 gc:universal Amastigsp_a12623_14:356-742(+)